MFVQCEDDPAFVHDDYGAIMVKAIADRLADRVAKRDAVSVAQRELCKFASSR